MAFYDDPKFQLTAAEATRMANRTGDKYRIFRAYGSYCIRAASNPYEGEHVAFVEPDMNSRSASSASSPAIMGTGVTPAPDNAKPLIKERT